MKVWDEAPGCEHEWSEKISHDSRYIYTQENSGKESVVADGNGYPKSRGSFCQRCSAWRGQLGLEPTFDLYIKHLCDIFDEIRRVLKPGGTVWVVIGDTYSGSGGAGGDYNSGGIKEGQPKHRQGITNLPSKCLCQIPSRFAIEMTDRGWILRSEIIWAKGVSFSKVDSGNVMPESVRDRPTSAHEKIFMFSKSKSYFYDQSAVVEDYCNASIKRISQQSFEDQHGGDKDYGSQGNSNRSSRKALENLKRRITAPGPENPYSQHRSYLKGHSGFIDGDGKLMADVSKGRNLRNVWRINPKPFPEAHFAVFPETLVEPIIKLGCPDGGIVLDPFSGSGTVAMMAKFLDRRYMGIELNSDYCKMAEKRVSKADMPLFGK